MTNRSDLDMLPVSSSAVRARLAAREPEQALKHAWQDVASALSDLAVVQLGNGDLESAVNNLRNALSACPDSRPAFHTLTAALLGRGMLVDGNLASIKEHLLANAARISWMSDYRHVLYLPRWLNLEFVLGRCNLKCRMCLGTNSPSYPDRLSYLSADDFERMLDAAPTVSCLTLSSGDSDPLLHPEIDRVLEIAGRRRVRVDLFTNGLPLGAGTCRKIVESGAASMINFSIDAATPETYSAIRGDRLDRVIGRIEMLQQMKQERGAATPMVGMSFVAMADNVAELPEFVRLATRLKAQRVYVEDLIGWDHAPHGNRPATENPRWAEFVREARALAGEAGLMFDVPQGLREDGMVSQVEPALGVASTDARAAEPEHGQDATPQGHGISSSAPPTVDSSRDSTSPDAAPRACAAAATPRLSCCSWIDGAYVNRDGRLDPCCLIHGVADMGGIHDGPLHKNEKYNRVKDLLLTGRVFRECLHQRMCAYVQQQDAAGIPLEVIPADEIECPAPTRSCDAGAWYDADASSRSLAVLSP